VRQPDDADHLLTRLHDRDHHLDNFSSEKLAVVHLDGRLTAQHCRQRRMIYLVPNVIPVTGGQDSTLPI
jgi:hypothetical protein